MIAHLVLLEPHAALTREQRHTILDRIQAIVTTCPAVRTCRVGRRVQHGRPGYEQAMRADYQYALVLEFADIDGLRAYLADPAHESIGELFTSATAAALAYDYEMADVRDAHMLL